jgi:hypothetical protein|tara:strand:+ start:887 stop:1345 length:459 start_codon:yes stop_codon:yes gene_type:complete
MYQKTLTDKQSAFVTNFSQTGNATQSAITAGYSPTTAEQQGYNLKQSLSAEIDTATRKLMGATVPMAIEKLRRLLVDDKTPASVQLGAINSILDRTGYQTTHKVEDVTNRRSDAELQVELEHLMTVIKQDAPAIEHKPTVNLPDPKGAGLVN